jgi:hypothetical protein
MSNADNLDSFLLLQPLLELTEFYGIKNLHELWQLKVDEQWHLAINAENKTVTVEPPGSVPVSIQPFHICVWYSGWIVAVYSAYGGWKWFATAIAANLETFEKAIYDHVERKRNERDNSSHGDSRTDPEMSGSGSDEKSS